MLEVGDEVREAESNIDADEDRTPLRNPKLRKHRSRDHSLIRLLNVDLKVLLGFAIIAFLIVLFMIHRLIIAVEHPQKPRVVTPFPAPKIMDLPQVITRRACIGELIALTFILEFVRVVRTPQSLVAGLMWLGLKDGRYFMRHVCQDSDELKTHGWTYHNGRDYGRQMLVDQDMTLMTSFLKSKEDGSGYGGDWAVRIDVQMDIAPKPEIFYKTTYKKIACESEVEIIGLHKKKCALALINIHIPVIDHFTQSKLSEEMQTVHLFFYLADEDGNALSLCRETLNIRENSVLAFGSRTDDDLKVHYSGFRTSHIHNLSDLVQQNLGAQILGRISFRIDVAFISGTGVKDSRVKERLSSLTEEMKSEVVKALKRSKWCSAVILTGGCGDKMGALIMLDSESISTGKAAVASLLGGIGYFYGQ
ncbi:unnamed protein product [Camellia sinensis]